LLCLTLSESLYKKAKGRGKTLGAVPVVQAFPEPFFLYEFILCKNHTKSNG
jgi:hypothetical protein